MNSPRFINGKSVKLNLWQTLRDFWRFGEWKRERMLFTPVYPGDPRYDEAPYEMGFLFR